MVDTIQFFIRPEEIDRQDIHIYFRPYISGTKRWWLNNKDKGKRPISQCMESSKYI
jgi:hypothetical protein